VLREKIDGLFQVGRQAVVAQVDEWALITFGPCSTMLAITLLSS